MIYEAVQYNLFFAHHRITRKVINLHTFQWKPVSFITRGVLHIGFAWSGINIAVWFGPVMPTFVYVSSVPWTCIIDIWCQGIHLISDSYGNTMEAQCSVIAQRRAITALVSSRARQLEQGECEREIIANRPSIQDSRDYMEAIRHWGFRGQKQENSSKCQFGTHFPRWSVELSTAVGWIGWIKLSMERLNLIFKPIEARSVSL